MKLKKLFAGIVAVAMMATMGVTSVFATEKAPVVPTAPTDKQVSIKKVITGTGYGSETVKLEVENYGKAVAVYHTALTTDGAPTISIPEAEKDGITIKEPTAPATTAEDTLHIQLKDYSRVGTYVYKFKEVAGKTAGMTYDTNSKWLVVNVYNDVDNTSKEIKANSNLLVNAVVVSQDPTHALESETRTELAKIDQIDNKYEAGTYTVKKQVKGNMSDRAKEFNFRVTFEKAKGATIPGIKVGETALNLEWKVSTTNPDVEVATYDDFQLSHNGEKTFSNIPYGVKVSVVELTDGKAELTTTDGKLMNGEYEVTYKDNKNVATEINKDNVNVTVTIINDSQVNVNTGVILDNAPYIALLTIVAAGAVVMIMKKRRNYED